LLTSKPFVFALHTKVFIKKLQKYYLLTFFNTQVLTDKIAKINKINKIVLNRSKL